ncbi:MAG: sodium/solute symporter [Gemmatimonadota bacterium]|nr:MAG: sodium/solute symporter [Gemmatimonadota bacterium]
MENVNLDLIIFALYLICVAAVGILVSRKKTESDDYFLASRNLPWWIIGGSLIAANISTHHFVGMSGQGFSIGLAIASYEWIAAIALIIYGKFFLPYYLKTKITTMPEFLEKRFNQQVRLVFAVISLVGYIFIELAVVLYTGSLAMESIFGLPLVYGLAILCIVAGGYTIYGGLRSVAYTDIIQVTVLMLGGIAVTIIGLLKVGAATPEYSNTILGGLKAIVAGSPGKFHMVQSWNHPELPWIGVFFGGMWLANIFYWGCNQFITQRTLAARNVWHGQMGVVFAGYLKLIVPILVVLPGIIAFRLYDPATGLLSQEFALSKADLAFPTLVKRLLPAGISGLVMAGLMGAVMSTIASLLTSSSSIFTFDIYKRHLKRDAENRDLIRLGRVTTFTVLIVATVFGYFLRDLTAIFTYIQKFWSIAWPAVVAVFLAGFFYKRANAKGCLITIVAGPIWAILFTIVESAGIIPKLAFLNRAGIDFLFCCLIIWFFRVREKGIPDKAMIDRSLAEKDQSFLKTVPWYYRFKTWSIVLIAMIVFLYIRFF